MENPNAQRQAAELFLNAFKGENVSLISVEIKNDFVQFYYTRYEQRYFLRMQKNGHFIHGTAEEGEKNIAAGLPISVILSLIEGFQKLNWGE
jgi:hypothetical protein